MALNRNPDVPSKTKIEKTARLGQTLLYLSDIDSLMAGLSERCEHVALIAGSAEADGANDLREARKDELREVRIATYQPDTVTTLTPYTCEVSAGDTSEEAEELVDFTAAVLREHRYLPATAWLGPLFLLIATLGGGLLIGFVTRSPSREASLPDTTRAAILVILATLLAIVLSVYVLAQLRRYKRRSGTKIIPMTRDEARRNGFSGRTSVVSGIGGAVVGAAITILGTQLTK